MKFSIATLLTALLILTVVGCSDSSSFSEAEARRVLAAVIQDDSAGQITLVGFKKTEGQKSEFAGVHSYQLDFEAEIQFEADGIWLKDRYEKLNFKVSGAANKGSWAEFGNTIQGGVPITRGGRATIAGNATGQKTDNGWKIEISQSRLLAGPTASSITTTPPVASTAEETRQANPVGSGDESQAKPRPDHVIFRDSFDAPTIDSSKWIVSGNSVSESERTMHVLTTVTDAGGTLTSVPIPVNRTGRITVTRRVFIHPGNNYFLGRFGISIGSLGMFSVQYANMDYSDGATYMARRGFFIVRNNARADMIGSQGDVSDVITPIWDSWFNEKITYEPTMGILEYFIDNERRLTYNVGVMPSSPSPSAKLVFNAWGWNTGHEQLFTYLRASQESEVKH